MISFTKKSNLTLLSEIIKDPDSKSVPIIFFEIFILFLNQKKFPRHYFSKYLFKKNITNIKDYYPEDFLYYKLKPVLNERAVRDVVENKLYFDFFYKQFNVPLPKILLYNHRNLFVKGNENFKINNVSDFKKELSEIFEQNLALGSIFIKRTYGSYGGKEVFRISREQLSSQSDLLDDLYLNVIRTGFLFQETVKQHPKLNMLNPSSLNTIRIDTFIDKEGNIDIISAYIRMSINNKHVDNISSGGCQVGISLQTGILKKDGYSGFSNVGTQVFTKHPITGVVFEGFEIPYFAEVKELIVKVAGYMPGLRLVGWDVAISESGPVLIEGNSDYAMGGNDMSEGGYRTNAVFRKMLHELNYL
jgi:hypothetical protein